MKDRASFARSDAARGAGTGMSQDIALRMATAPGDSPAPGSRLMRRLDALCRFSADEGSLTRLYLTPEHRAAAEQVTAWMREAGMTVSLDAAATVIGRYEGQEPGLPALLLGSHIDTVRHAGRYDGMLGVLVAIEAVAALHAAGLRLPFAVEVLAFGDEEGVRFPVTLTGSRAVAGGFDPSALESRDAEGVSLREALHRFGVDPAAIPTLARRPDQVLAYLEVHIEQGPVLEAEGLPTGIVTAINGATRFVAEIGGTAGHAGTVPMHLRRDAVAAMAEMVLAVERLALEEPDLVATVGQVTASPGAVNVIAAGARFTIDIRSPRDALRHAACGRLRDELSTIAARRGVSLSLRPTYDEAAAPCDPALIEALEGASLRCGLRPFRLPSGAGHDGLAMARLCPIGMIFVRCEGGISHHPAEAITEADALAALRLLLETLQHLQPRTFQRT